MTMNDEAGVKTESTAQHSVLNSTFPVVLPKDDALFMSEVDFHAFIKQEIKKTRQTSLVEIKQEIESIDTADTKTLSGSETKAPFVVGLEQHHAHHRTPADLAKENKALTENADVTNISSKNAIVDLFYELGEDTEGDKLKSLLDASWNEDQLLTLKIIFNARSIHLGKSSKIACYKALGWLAENHPLTLLTNLQWLVRPVIVKKAPSAAENAVKASGAADPQSTPPKTETKDELIDEDFDMVDADDADPAKAHDVRYGVSHGYWKDLLNLVVFAANDELKCDGDPASLLNQNNNSRDSKRKRKWDPAAAKEVRQQKKLKQNERVQEKLKHDTVYHALHIAVARLFAKQLKEDKALLDSGKKSDLKKLSLAAKWAPTHSEFHDKHTFILSSIAEILFPDTALHCPDADNRELYLRHVREHFRKQYTSPLRKALNVVERDIVANTFSNIKYERVPSLAMDRYSGLFMKKDYEHFKGYIQDVAKGSAKISGAVLLPSTLITKARTIVDTPTDHLDHRGKTDFKAAKAAAMAQIYADVVDGQWNTLLQRVRDAGTLQSSIAVCDVSGSMLGPHFKDGSCPMDSAIGLSLLIAEVTAPPFGGGFITFSETPTYLSIGRAQDTKGLVEKVKYISGSDWGMNTNFVAVFEDIILPMAIKTNIRQEDMVKQIFVFSDMQFDSAHRGGADRWTSSYERIKKKYADAGYDMPRLIFWNLAAHSTDKPTTMGDVDTALVSGYSQGMLKAFLETGAFDEEEELVEEEVEAEGKDGMTEIRKVRKKLDPLTVVKKAVGHNAYSMLEVVD